MLNSNQGKLESRGPIFESPRFCQSVVKTFSKEEKKTNMSLFLLFLKKNLKFINETLRKLSVNTHTTSFIRFLKLRIGTKKWDFR